jgi:cephalosporin hydroxylase
MDITAISGNTATAAIVRQLQTISEVQTAVMAQIADSQQQMADILAAAGIGQTIDIHA